MSDLNSVPGSNYDGSGDPFAQGLSLADVPKNYRSVHNLDGRTYETRTCAERHDEQLGDVMEHVHAMTVLYSKEIAELRTQIDALSATVAELKNTLAQWEGDHR